MYRLRTLGGISLEQDRATLDTVGAQRKTLALLALLAVSRSRGISRDRVAAYLWPESDTERARGALKQTVHIARRHLGSPEAIQGKFELRLNPSYIESDVGAFLSALESDEPDVAAELYGGPFLDGFHLPGAPEFEEWVSAQRDDLARRYVWALERLTSAAEARGEVEAAVGWLRRLQAADPFSARATVRLMRALDARGERVAAIRCAQIHESLLRYELGNSPDPEVAALAAHLREAQAFPRAPEESALPASSIPAPPVSATPAAAAAPLSSPPDPIRSDASNRAPRRPSRAVSLAAFAATALAIAALVAVRLDPDVAPAAAVSEGRSVAVLPFENVDGDSAIEHLAYGLTDELTTALSRVDALRVAPRTIASALRRQGLGARAVADSLRVGAVVEGAIRRDAGRLEIRVRLLNARDEVVLWAEAYDRAAHDVVDLPQEIGRGVVAALYPQRPVAAGTSLANGLTNHPVAYDLYLRARHSWRQRTREELQQAVVYYEGAIEQDPAFAMAYVGLADAYVNLSNFGYRDGGEAIARARVAAERARALAPQLAETNASLGFVLASQLDLHASEAASDGPSS
ncbi:MAG TPA: BTAD domain-containing putative transcriptional regulator [Gemmatimonadales bacterium]